MLQRIFYGIPVASTRFMQEGNVMKSQQYVRIMALLNAMVLCVNQRLDQIEIATVALPLASMAANGAPLHAKEAQKH
jgi:hypothetical protein